MNLAVILLLIAAVIAMLTRRLRMPYSVGLVVAGMALAAVPFFPQISLTRELIFTALLPPLIFEAALYLPLKDVRRDLVVILVLAILGVILSAAITAVGMVSLAHWPWQSALVFGMLIAATDPVSVIATFREAGVHGRLRVLVEAESLFNDGVAAVGFTIAVALTSGQTYTAFDSVAAVLMAFGGGVICGAVVAGIILLLAGRTVDPLVELTFTAVAAYGSFLLAEQLHVSGVLATLTAGMMLGNFVSQGAISDRGKESVLLFWEFAAFVANSLVFLLIGIDESRQHFATVWFPAVVAIALVTLGRAASVYPLCMLFYRSSLRVASRHQHVLFWGGLRGALALALALGLPADLPGRAEIVTVSFAVVAFSVFVQGLTMTPLLRALGEIPAAPLKQNL